MYGVDCIKVLGTYLTGFPFTIKFGDLGLLVTRKNVDRVISIANLIINLNLPREPIINLSIKDESLKLDFTNAIRDELEFRRLLSIALFKYYLEKFRKKGGFVRKIDDANLIQGELDGIIWFFRRYYYADIYAGPLAPYEEEPHEFDWVTRILLRSTKPVFIDVGACVGGYSIRACKLGAVTISLEPDRGNYEILKKHLEVNECTDSVALNIAAGSSTGRLPLYSQDYNSTVSSLKYGRKFQGYVDVKTLDEVLNDMGFLDNRIDVLKIDVEGAEVDVLKGADKTLANSRYLLLEIWDQNLHDVYKMLKTKFKPVAEVRYVKGVKYRNVLFKNFSKF
jgi:FkbM family methyltransferase